MVSSSKRKECHGDNAEKSRGAKRSKGGSGGKWQTPHQKIKMASFASRGSGRIEPGDAGIWATCARGQEGRATEELKAIFDDCAERFYGIAPAGEGIDEDEDDIEVSIEKEISSLTQKKGITKTFSPVHLDIICVLFFKTQPSIDAVEFVHRLCEDAVSNPAHRRSKYVNRLTPMTLIGKATERGLEELGTSVLAKHFQLAGQDTANLEDATPCTYAIRPTIRNHNTLKRDVVIKQIAGLVSERHKVDLTKPDKVIIVEIYQTVCGISVVGSDWDALKRFNLAELYPTRSTIKVAAMENTVDSVPEAEKTNES
ncbi:THUMP domain-containing protein [Phlyctema vagabunda]|uniref:THUMP domain-containing protein n=1 Tax=Phlyctema vagabunda TaxID=108571 RepID=A0ABR4PS67_9HELO